jgi:hypothetical protein
MPLQGDPVKSAVYGMQAPQPFWAGAAVVSILGIQEAQNKSVCILKKLEIAKRLNLRILSRIAHPRFRLPGCLTWRPSAAQAWIALKIEEDLA